MLFNYKFFINAALAISDYCDFYLFKKSLNFSIFN